MDTAAASREFVVPRRQIFTSLALLVLLLITCLGTDLLARSPGLEHWLTVKSSNYAKINNTGFSYTGNFIDFEERLLLDELPHADYSRGGIYFFGTSNTKWAFTTWDLPPAVRHWIGNYGIGASNHTTVLNFIRYLIEEREFLKSGEANLVVIGVSFHLELRDNQNDFFVSLLRRRGLFTVAADGQMVSERMNPTEQWLRIEKARSGGFIWNCARLLKSWLRTFAGGGHSTPHDGALYRQYWRSIMGEHWRDNMDVQLEQLKKTIALLRSKNAQVKIIMLPQGTWMDELPFKSRYEMLVKALCQETSTPLIDLSRAMPDEAFVDSNHLTVEGQSKFRDLIMREVTGHLQKLQTNNFVDHK